MVVKADNGNHIMHIYAKPTQWGSYDIYLDGIYWRGYRISDGRLVRCGVKEGIVVSIPTQAQIEEAIFKQMKSQAA